VTDESVAVCTHAHDRRDSYHVCVCVCVCVKQELKEFLNRVGEVTFADAHKEHVNEGSA